MIHVLPATRTPLLIVEPAWANATSKALRFIVEGDSRRLKKSSDRLDLRPWWPAPRTAASSKSGSKSPQIDRDSERIS